MLAFLDLRRNPLNRDAFCVYIPMILANNPGIDLQHDPNPYNCADPIQLLEELAIAVTDLNLQSAISNSLIAQLEAALQVLEDENEQNDVAAVNSLGAFINLVEAQKDKKISAMDANALIAAAQEIINLLESP